MRFMQLARSTLKTPTAAEGRRDTTGSCRLTLRPFSSQEGTGTRHGHAQVQVLSDLQVQVRTRNVLGRQFR